MLELSHRWSELIKENQLDQAVELCRNLDAGALEELLGDALNAVPFTTSEQCSYYNKVVYALAQAPQLSADRLQFLTQVLEDSGSGYLEGVKAVMSHRHADEDIALEIIWWSSSQQVRSFLSALGWYAPTAVALSDPTKFNWPDFVGEAHRVLKVLHPLLSVEAPQVVAVALALGSTWTADASSLVEAARGIIS